VLRKLIRATPGSYNGFMKQVGRDGGIGSDTYSNAVLFFAKRERRAKRAAAANPGAPAPVAPAEAPTAAASEPAPKRRKQAKAAPAAKRVGDDSAYDISEIHLDGEERDAVPLFDTCDDIRTKTRAHFRQPNCTQAALLRQLGAQFILQPRALRSPQINTFMRQKGPLEGNSSGIFYGAYVYFEKLRIKNGKSKSKKREEMEQKWGPEGVDRAAGGGAFGCRAGEVPVQDSYGCITFHRR
jgi:pyruvate/2-oxoglutarate dehydrogenase complex dihydrolipoamide acyltransferase (E2) component